MKFYFNPSVTVDRKEVVYFIEHFDTQGELFVRGKRNIIKTYKSDDLVLNAKSFKVPHFINKIAYKYFRKSKAERSFANALTLLKNGIGTPMPIAYFESSTFLGLKESYYVCEHLRYDFTFREIIKNPNLPDGELLIRLFTRLTFKMHEKGIEFKDHSPGNTLIRKTGDSYELYLVDLNRMTFHKTMSFDLRMKNLCRITPKKEMIAIMSDEYAKCINDNPDRVFQVLWSYTEAFQQRFHNKKKWKKRLKIS